MVLIKAKLDGFETKGQLERERVQKWLKAQLEKAPRQLLFGCRGMGKTTALLSFIRKNYRNRYGYYCLDDCDNDIAQFQAYFVTMIKNAGIFAKENLKEVKLHEMICMILKALEDDKEKRILVFDGVDRLRNLEIIEELPLHRNCSRDRGAAEPQHKPLPRTRAFCGRSAPSARQPHKPAA